MEKIFRERRTAKFVRLTFRLQLIFHLSRNFDQFSFLNNSKTGIWLASDVSDVKYPFRRSVVSNNQKLALLNVRA